MKEEVRVLVIVGATGVNVRTGEFYIFKAKTTIVATSTPGRLWIFIPELSGSKVMTEINDCGDGVAIGWKAGADFALMEQVRGAGNFDSYIPYGVGNSSNTYHGTPIVDARGHEVPWSNKDGKELKTSTGTVSAGCKPEIHAWSGNMTLWQ